MQQSVTSSADCYTVDQWWANYGSRPKAGPPTFNINGVKKTFLVFTPKHGATNQSENLCLRVSLSHEFTL